MVMSKYKDIIRLPHHVSKKHPHMSNYDRAAQFSPFAALTGHDAAVAETARLTDSRVELDDGAKELLDGQLHRLTELMMDGCEDHEFELQSGIVNGNPVDVEVTYFKPDVLKDGGAYLVKRGSVRKLNNYRKVLILEDLTEINIADLIKIEFI